MSLSEKSDMPSVLPANVTGNREAHLKHWLVAEVRMHHEKKTSERLSKIGIENYLPIQQKIHLWSDRRKKIDHIVLPMKLFVHVDLHQRREVLMLSSVFRYLVLRGARTPAIIPDKQMEQFRFMLDYSEEAISMNDAPLSPGEWIRVLKGPLSGMEGELITVNGKTKVAIRLDALGCASVNMPIGFIERIAKCNDI